MDDVSRRPVAAPLYAAARSASHQIPVCKVCKDRGLARRSDFPPQKQLRAACLTGNLPAHGKPGLADRPAKAKAICQSIASGAALQIDDPMALSRPDIAKTDRPLTGKECLLSLIAKMQVRIPAALVAPRARVPL